MADDIEIETKVSRAFDRGNYDAAYVTNDCKVPSEMSEAEGNAYMLGFYGSYELHEIDEDHRDKVAVLRGQELLAEIADHLVLERHERALKSAEDLLALLRGEWLDLAVSPSPKELRALLHLIVHPFLRDDR